VRVVQQTATSTTATTTTSPSFSLPPPLTTRRRPTHQHGDRLGEADGVAQVAAERPVLQQQRGDERERDAEERHEQVADGHVHDEQVGDRVHLRREHDHVAHQPVADQRHDEHDRVGQVDECLERGRAQRPFDLGVTGRSGPVQGGRSFGGVPRCGRHLNAVVLGHCAAVLSSTGHL